MSVDFESKFRASGLDPEDCAPLRDKILESRDRCEILLSLIYIYGRSCDEDQEVKRLCDEYIRVHKIPGLTAVRMKVMIDYWEKWEEYSDVLKSFFDISLYDEWHDEVLFVTSFVRKNVRLPFSPNIRRRFIRITSSELARELGMI